MLSGTAHVLGSTSSAHCSWWATGVRFGRQSFDSYFYAHSLFRTDSSSDVATPLTVGSSGVNSGCPVAASALLPTGLKHSARWHFGATSSSTLVGRQWLRARMGHFAETVSSSYHRTADYDTHTRSSVVFRFTGEVTDGTTAMARLDQIIPVSTSTFSDWTILSASCTAISGLR